MITEAQTITIVFLALGAFCSSVCMHAAFRAHRKRRYLLDTPTSKADGVFIGDVELKGSAEIGVPLTSYLAQAQCVVYYWKVTEHWCRESESTYTDSKGEVHTVTTIETGEDTVAEGGDSAPFFLCDDSGQVLVRPKGARLELVKVFSQDCEPDDPLYYSKGPRRSVSGSVQRRTFYELAIPIHQLIYVQGRARERLDIAAPEIAEDPEAREFFISTRTEEQISFGFAFEAWAYLLLGALFAAGGFGMSEQFVQYFAPQRVVGYSASIGAYFLVYAFFWTWSLYNSLATLRERVRRAWSNIDVELKRRCDLLPNLAASVKGLRDHEAETQKVVALLRSQAALAATDVRGGSARVVGLAPLFTALAERYPELVAQQGFLKLQEELVRTENRIALSRTYYNGIATAFNARIAGFPHMLLAMLAGLRAFPMFEATRLERQAERVSFAE